MMSGMARKSLGAAVGDGKGGLAFYEFSDIADTRGFIDEWYVCLRGYFSDASRRRRGGGADSSPTRRGDAAARRGHSVETSDAESRARISRGNAARRRRGRDADSSLVNRTPRPRRGYSVAATWKYRSRPARAPGTRR